MLTPEYLLHISDGSEEIASQLHTNLMKKIIGRVMARKNRGDDYILTAVDKWQIQVLQEAGYLLEDVQNEIAKYSGYQAKEIARAMEDAGVTATKYDDKTYKDAGIEPPPPLEQSPEMIRLMQRNYEKTMGTWTNFTGTTANACHQEFINTMDEIYASVMSGGESYIQAYENAIDRLCGNGLVITYPSGHKDTLETAALRCVRTGVAQATAEIQLARMKEMDEDLVLVSSHQGARPSHQEWQGKVYSLGKSSKYPNFYQSTHYGEGNGLCGWNCRHHFGSYVEGMANPYKDYSNEENVEKYEQTQEQRRMERNIRKTKRAIEGYKEALDGLPNGDPMKKTLEEKLKAQKDRLKAQNAAYKAYCKEKKLKELPERLRIAKAGKAGDEYNINIIDVKPPRREETVTPPPIKPQEPEVKPVEPVKKPIEPSKPEPKPVYETEPEKAAKTLTAPAEEWVPSERFVKNLNKTAIDNETPAEDFVSLVNSTGNRSLIKTMGTWTEYFDYERDYNSRFDDKHERTYWDTTEEWISRCPYHTLAHELGHGFASRADSIGVEDYTLRDDIERAILKFVRERFDDDSDESKMGRMTIPMREPDQADSFIAAMQKDIDNLANGIVTIDEEEDERLRKGTERGGVDDFLDGAFGARDFMAMTDKGPLPGLTGTVPLGHGDRYYNRKGAVLQQIGIFDDVVEELQKKHKDMDEKKLWMYMRDYETASELWANITAAIAVQRDDGGENLEGLMKFCPNAVKKYQELLDKHADALDRYEKKGIPPHKIPKKLKAPDVKVPLIDKLMEKCKEIRESRLLSFMEAVINFVDEGAES